MSSAVIFKASSILDDEIPEVYSIEDHKMQVNRFFELKEQYPNAGKPWSKEENQWMMAAWRKGASVEEMAAELGRTPKAICCRLENNGIWADYSPSEDEPPRWTATDTQNLLKMVAEGYSISRIAERFHRTEKAIEARMFYLGLTKKAPNLFGKEK